MPPPMISNARLVAGALTTRRGDSEGGVKLSSTSVPVSSAAARRMVRTSSSTERPLLAARRRKSFFNRSSSCRTVRDAMGKPALGEGLSIALMALQSVQSKSPFNETLDREWSLVYLT